MLTLPRWSSLSFPWSGSSQANGIHLKPLPTKSIEAFQDKPSRVLKHLIRLNHASYAILYHDFKLYNRVPHLLCAAYLLGASERHLEERFNALSGPLERWTPSPSEIATYDWQNYLGQPEYQRAYLDFFEDQVVQSGYRWKAVVSEYFAGQQSISPGLLDGFAHTVDTLAYAYELDRSDLAMEALALGASCFGPCHRHMRDMSSIDNPVTKSHTLRTILDQMAADNLFGQDWAHVDENSLQAIFDRYTGQLDTYLVDWNQESLDSLLEDCQSTATWLLIASRRKPSEFNISFARLLTSSQALRLLLPHLPGQHHASLIRQWGYLAICTYIQQGTPSIDPLEMEVDGPESNSVDIGWVEVAQKAVQSPWANDAEYMKTIHAFKGISSTWVDRSNFFVEAAIKFSREFGDWA